MAVLFMEGFGHCATGMQTHGSDINGLFLNWGGWKDGTFNLEIVALEDGDMGVKKYLTPNQNNYGYQLRSRPWEGVSEITVGMRIYRYAAEDCVICYVGDQGYLGIRSTGEFVYSADRYGNLNDATESWAGTTQLTLSQWTYVEANIVFSQTVGEVYLYVNGALDLSQTGIDTIKSGAVATAQYITIADPEHYTDYTKQYWRWTDIYVTDGEVLGPVEVYYQPADTAGSAANFTPLSGSNHENVDETADPDGDTTYNVSTTPGTKDQIAHDVAHTLGPKAIQPVAFVRSVGDEGMAKVKVGVLSDSVEDLGDQHLVDNTYTPIIGDIYETDPATGSAWTASGADAAETVISHPV